MTASLKSTFVKVMVLFFTALALRGQAQTVKLLRGPAYDVALTGDSGILKIPLTIEGDSAFPRLQLADVSLDNPVRTVSLIQFNIHPETDSFHNKFLIVSIANKPPLSQGKYHLLIDVFKAKVPTPEILSIDLTVKAATLMPVNNVVVSYISSCPFASYKVSTESIRLFENSGNAMLSPITISKLSVTDAKGQALPVSVIFPKSIPPLNSTEPIDIPYKVDGDLPIGVSSANFEINAPQLTAPVTFHMDITTKRTGWWIVFIIFLGVLFSFIVKQVLQTILEVSRARKDVLDFIAQLEAEKNNRPDETFVGEVDGILGTLKRTLSSKKAVDITDAVTTAKNTYTEAVNKFNERLTSVTNATQAFSVAITSGVWVLPQSITNIIKEATKKIEEINKLLKGNNPGEAETRLNGLIADTATGLSEQITNVKKRFEEAYARMRNSGLKIFTPESALLKILGELDAALAAIPEDRFEENVANINALLRSLSDQRMKTNHLFYEMLLTIRLLLENINRTLANAGVDLNAELSAIVLKADTMFNLQTGDALEVALDNVGVNMQEIQQDIIAVFTAEKLQLSGAQYKELSQLLNDGQYLEAADKLVGFKALIINEVAQETPPGTEITHKFTQGIPASLDATVRLPGWWGGVDTNPFATTTYLTGPVSFAQTYTRVTKTILWVSIVQTLLIFVGLTLFGYLLFQEKFTGTSSDMIEVFAWAFTLDISLAGLLNLAKTSPKHIGS